MNYKILEHTADARIYVDGKDLAELFESAIAGMMEMYEPEGIQKETADREVFVESDNQNYLLIDFLNEILILVNRHKEIYTIKKFKKISNNEVEVILSGRRANHFNKDIKAATYHEANIQKNDEGLLETNIVFDI